MTKSAVVCLVALLLTWGCTSQQGDDLLRNVETFGPPLVSVLTYDQCRQYACANTNGAGSLSRAIHLIQPAINSCDLGITDAVAGQCPAQP